MADTSPNYRIWQSPESVLIQAGAGSIELSIADARAMAADITARLALRLQRRAKWTPATLAEIVRLYRDEGMGSHRIAKSVGTSIGTVDRVLKNAGVTKRPGKSDSLIAARAAKRAKRVA